jgi:hypothetical protein
LANLLLDQGSDQLLGDIPSIRGSEKGLESQIEQS